MAKHGWLIWTVLPLLLAAGLWWLTQPTTDSTRPDMGFVGNERTTGSVPTRAELSDMRAKAENACRCARGPRTAGGAPPSCWQEFNQAVSRFPHSEMTSACAPLSTTVVCFGDGMDACVTRDHGGGACTIEEARTIDAIWTEAMRNGGSQASERANRRIAEALQSFIRGERVTVRQTSGGCMG